MQILLCMNRDLAATYALNLLLKEIGPSHEWRIFLSEPGKGTKRLPPAFGELELVEQDVPNRLLFPLLERLPAGGRPELQSVERWSTELGIPLHVVHKLDDAETLKAAQDFAPDLILSIRFRKIFKGPYLQLAKHGILNLHSGPLPDYRGVMATFWALLNGESRIGCSLHYVSDASIDTGPLVGRALLPVDPARSLSWHILSLYPEGARLMAEAVREIERSGGPLPAEPQSEGLGHYYSVPQAADVERFRAKGLRLTDPEDALEFWARFVPRASSKEK